MGVFEQPKHPEGVGSCGIRALQLKKLGDVQSVIRRYALRSCKQAKS